MNAKKKRILTVVASLLGLLVAYLLFEHWMYVSTDNAQVQADTILLAPKIPGYISAVHVKENQKVKLGDVLAEIVPSDYQNALKQYQNEVQGIEARYHDAEKNFVRASSLLKTGAVSRQQYDAAQAAYLELKGRFASAQAQFSQAQLNFDYTKIRAPSNGVIARKSANVGMLAAPGTPLFGFVSNDERWVIANFKETELGRIRIGSRALVKVDALSGDSFEGEVESISPATGATFTLLPPDNATGNFTKVVQRVPVRIRFKQISETDLDRLRAGLSAWVRVSSH